MTAERVLSRTPILDRWQLRLLDAAEDAPALSAGRPIPAVLPGTVHTDLLRAGLLDDPDIGTNEHDQQWVGRSTWAYATVVPWESDGAERVELVCDGLDTVATVLCNGLELGRTRNMHRTHRFDVTDRLRPGANELQVVLHPVHEEIDRVRAQVGVLAAAFAPRRVTVQPDRGDLVLASCNDHLEPWSATVDVRRVRFDGTELARLTLPIDVPAMGVTRLRLAPALAVPDTPRRELLVVNVPGTRRSTWFWARDRDLDDPLAAWDADATPIDGGLAVVVTARTLVRDLALFPDRLLVEGGPLGAEAVASDLLLTLLPGETTTFTVSGARAEHRQAITKRPVLRAANDLREVRRAG